MNLRQAIEADRRRHARYARAARVLRQVRLRIFEYDDAGKLDKALRVIARCKRVLEPLWQAQKRAADAARLLRTPSVFEPGIAGG